ncbi:hypothetical protein ACFWY6_09665 [Streptomyces sp. NPDC059037]|uniref:5'-methylthioadenosine/S-adenosylhomocysteine nucleosidase family protein n=1 Tax=Streptomyces sp. NPDC059037 TaxID=3346710 RepID=UPI0036A91E12
MNAGGGVRAQSVEEACLTLVYLLHNRRREWALGQHNADELGHIKRNMLIADYARKALDLPVEVRQDLDRMVVESFLPPHPTAPWRGPVMPPPPPEPEPVDVAVVVVIIEELDAALGTFGMTQDDFNRDAFVGDQRFFPTRVPNRYRPEEPLSVVVTSAGRSGNVQMVKSVDALLKLYEPELIGLLGTACGVPEAVRIGDVVACDRVYYFPPGRRLPGKIFQPRPKHGQGRSDYGHGLHYYNPARTDYASRVREFVRGLSPAEVPETFSAARIPDVHTTGVTIASGEEVLRDGELLPGLREVDNTICAGDMESYGFSQAAEGLPWLIFRGISDFGPGREERWKYVSTSFAALCLEDFLRTRYLPPGADDL